MLPLTSRWKLAWLTFFPEAITGSRIYNVYCFVVNYLPIIKRSIDSLRVGFEPTRVEPIRFQV